MSDGNLSSLFEAAKAETPSAAARARVWAKVSSSVGAAGAAASGGAGAGGAGAGGLAKMLTLGTLLGGPLTVGLGLALLHVGPARPADAALVGFAAPAPAASAQATAFVLPEGTEGATVGNVEAHAAAIVPVAAGPAIASTTTTTSTSTTVGVGGAAGNPGAGRAVALRAPQPDDSLAREAAIVAGARDALARRDAIAALQTIRTARALPSRQLVPEEMAVEAQALRALGLDDEAAEVHSSLRARFPDSILERE